MRRLLASRFATAVVITALAGAALTLVSVLVVNARIDDRELEQLEGALANGVGALDGTLEPTSRVFALLVPVLAQDTFDEAAFQDAAGPVVRENAFITNVAVLDAGRLLAAVDEQRLRVPPPEATGPIRLSGPPFIGDFTTYEEADSVVLIFDVQSPLSPLTMRAELVLPRTYLSLLAQAATADTAIVYWIEADAGPFPIVSTIRPIPEGTRRLSEQSTWGTTTLTVEAIEISGHLTTTDRLMPWAVAGLGTLATVLVLVVMTNTRRRRIRLDELERETLRLDREIVERLEVERLLAHQASHDALTGLPNRAALITALTRRLEPGSEDPVGAVLFLDIDRFKEVNDSVGHSAGDELLSVIAQRLAAIAPDDAMLTRFGGDEFVIVTTPGTDVGGLSDRIHEALRPGTSIAGQSVSSTTSIGIREVDGNGVGDESVEPLDLIRDADAAMYVAKREGRDRHFFFNREVHRLAVDRMSFRGDAERALASGEFVVHFQPVVNLDTDELEAVETLVRWDHPDLGLLFPDRFLGVLTDTDVGVRLDGHVRQTASAQARLWRDRGLYDGPLLVNVSANTLLHPDFERSINDLMAEHEIGPGQLGVEVTEQTLIVDVDRAIEVLSRLRDRGMLVAIDDFGTGYSSLSYLHRLPFDILKIDASFTENVIHDSAARSIVATIADLALRLDVKVIAEGVADQDTKRVLANLGCTQGQGRFLSPAIDSAEFTQWLEGRRVHS